MSELSEAVHEYIKNNGENTMIADFLSDETNQAKVFQWFKGYNNYDSACSGLRRKFTIAYSKIYKKSKMNFKNQDFDAKTFFKEASASKKIEQEGLLAIVESITRARKNLERKEKISDKKESTSSSNSLATRMSNYVIHCKELSRQQGFFLPDQIPKILAAKGIILSKNNHIDPDLVKEIGEKDLNALTEDIKNQYLNPQVKVKDSTFEKLTAIMRGINEKSDRETLKREVYKLLVEAESEDLKVLEIMITCLNKLPGFVRVGAVGEMELTTNFLDPVFSPLFHQPQQNRHFLWLNRQDESIMSCINQRCANVTLGFCEVKPGDCKSVELLANDLFRLARLCLTNLLRKEKKVSLCVQAIGYKSTFYLLVEMSDDLVIMLEVFSLDVPKQISELSSLVSQVDMLKRISHLYKNDCQCHYAQESGDLPSLSDNFNNIINPKKRKHKDDEPFF